MFVFKLATEASAVTNKRKKNKISSKFVATINHYNPLANSIAESQAGRKARDTDFLLAASI